MMMNSKQSEHLERKTPVAIVGAGPAGLSLALGLSRLGVRSTLLERKRSTSTRSKAPAVHVRTREVYQQWGIDDRMVDAGELLETMTMYSPDSGRKPVLSFDFSELEIESDRPGFLFLEQGQTEKILLETLQETGLCDIHFGAEVVELVQRKAGVTLSYQQDGGENRLSADYAVGCDGASSFVRSALGIAFEGITYSIRPMLADVHVDDDRDTLPWPRIHNERGRITSALRLQPRHWRIIHLDTRSDAAEDAPEEEQVTQEEVNLLTSQVLGEGPVEVLWGSRFRMHRRSAARYRMGRVLLAGDAAHIHPPTGGQGMNSGIQDADNLSWKLAYALNGGDADTLLDSYEIERKAVVAGNVSRYTDFLTRTFLQTPLPVRSAAMLMLRILLNIDPIRKRSLQRATMIDLDLPDSPLIDPADDLAGERLPNPLLQTPEGETIRLYELLPVGAAIIAASKNGVDISTLPVESVIRIGPGAYRDLGEVLRERMDGKDGWIMVRPDGYIAWARTEAKGMDYAVRKALGLGL
jgi:2-polyprenyl-6-methoxyphenol hydroxylase-like FAD-dependent oxidoreductase